MGFLDKIKKGLSAANDKLAPQAAAAPVQEVHEEVVAAVEPEPEEQFDLAGFDPDDEEAYFLARQHMDSEGQFGGTDESRAEIMQRYGIRDRLHWMTVRDSVFAVLARKYGSSSEAAQREMNWKSGQMERDMQAKVAAAASGPGMAPVEGVALEAWAAINAAIVGGANHEDLLKGAGIDQARWERVSAEWNARMSRDTTFVVAKVYGEAFQNASKGKFAAHVKEAAAARAANRELQMEPPMSYEQYYDVLMAQGYASKQGKDPIQALKDCGLSIIDWTDLGTYMSYYFHRDAVRNWPFYEEIHKRIDAKYAAMYPGVKPDVDISF